MQHKTLPQLNKQIKRLELLRTVILIFLTTSLISGCAPELHALAAELEPMPAPIFSGCGWLDRIKPEAGFETRWTHGEKLQAVELNDKICANCPGRCPDQPKGN